MTVTSVQDLERFTPARYLVDGEVPAGVPVYLLAPMTWRERARFRAQIAGEGVRFPSDGELIRAVRATIAELAPTNADELLASVQAFEDALAQTNEPASGDETDEEKAARAEVDAARLEIGRQYEVIVDLLRQHPAVGNLLALRTLFHEIVPPLAAAYCLRGWENIAAKFERVNGVVPDRALDGLPMDDLLAIGNQALVLQSVSAAQKGN